MILHADYWKFKKYQEIYNKIDSFHSRIFYKDKRLGGQIFVENLLRIITWEYYAFDEIIKHFYFKDKLQNHEEKTDNIYKIFNLIDCIRC